MGAVSVSNVSQAQPHGNRRSVTANVVFSSSYATGGDTITPAQVGLQVIYEVWESQGQFADSPVTAATAFTPNTHGLQVVLTGSTTAPKLKALAGAAGTPAEVANATNLSTLPAVVLEFRGV